MGYFVLSILLFLAAPVYAIRWMRSPQFFNFVNLYWLLQCFLILPAALALVFGLSELQLAVLFVLNGTVVEAVSTFLALYGVMNIFVLIGLRFAAPTAKQLRALHGTVDIPPSSYVQMLTIWSLALVGFALFLLKVNQIGGFSFLFANVSNRVDLQSGLGPIGILQEVAFWVAILFSAQYAAVNREERIWLFSFILIMVLACATTTVFGGRKAAIQYIVGSLAIYSFFRPTFFRINIQNTLKIVSLIMVILVYFFVTKAYRDSNDLAQFSERIPELVGDTASSTSDIFLSLSYLDTYIFATEHFDENSRLNGATYLDLRTSLLPSALVEDKPPVDEGLYIRAATLGNRIFVGSPAWVYEHNSWPPETYGSAMMNFGPLSLPIFGFLLGSVMGLALKFLVSSRGSNLALLVAVTVFMNFELSNLRITNFVTFVIPVALILAAIQMILRGKQAKGNSLPA